MSKVIISVSLDPTSLAILDRISQERHEGNRSLALRAIIRELMDRPDFPQPEEKEAPCPQP